MKDCFRRGSFRVQLGAYLPLYFIVDVFSLPRAIDTPVVPFVLLVILVHPVDRVDWLGEKLLGKKFSSRCVRKAKLSLGRRVSEIARQKEGSPLEIRTLTQLRYQHRSLISFRSLRDTACPVL